MSEVSSAITSQPTKRTSPFDPPPEYTALRTQCPVAPMTLSDGMNGVVVTGYHEVKAVLGDERFGANRRQNRPGDTGDAGSPPQPAPGIFVMMDAPEHTRFRRLLAGKFTLRRVRQLTPRIEQYVTESLDAMTAAGGPVDLVQQFALPVPSLMICELLGVPYTDRDEFQRNSATMVNLDSSAEEVLQARTATFLYLHQLVQAKRVTPADDLLGDLIATDELTDEELAGVGLLLLVAGHETTATMIALGTMYLLENPDQLARLQTDDPVRMAAAVEELLRHLTILHLGVRRTTRENLEFGGELIKAGTTVVASLASANRDPEHIPGDPDVLDLDRSGARHLAFGYGIHQCLGQHLARVELTVALGALFSRFPTLRMVRPATEVPMRDNGFAYGPKELFVTW